MYIYLIYLINNYEMKVRCVIYIMYCPFINPDTNRLYTFDYVCCLTSNDNYDSNNDKYYLLCPMCNECYKEVNNYVMVKEEED